MYLHELQICNFRGIKGVTITFDKGVNVIIGKNNTGKTAIIDALRICLSYGKQWRDIYVRKEDFYIDETRVDNKLQPIEFHLRFAIEQPEEAGIFYELLTQNDDGTQEIQVHLRYYLDSKERIKWTVWGGQNEGQRVPSDVMTLITFVYLNPLRDAVGSLKPIRWNRLGELFAGLIEDNDGAELDDEKREGLANKLGNAVKGDGEWNSIIAAGKAKINEHLENTCIDEDTRGIELDFLPFEFRRIVDNIRVQLPVYEHALIASEPEKQRYFQLSQNGLGYNNLIYIATVLGDLVNKKEVEPEAYYTLLIEEPEAHLHPQLQNLFFEYMNRLKDKGIQLFITSHSPTITSKVELDSLIVLQKRGGEVEHLALRNSQLDGDNKKYLLKFLDVTKSQLFFANGVILVEGISEALLFPILAEKLDYYLVKSGVEVVNIGGVAFEHFAKLFNCADARKNLAARCAIVTDDDKNPETGEISNRARKARGFKRANLDVFLADVTFEKELFDGNEELVKSIYGEMHTRTTITDARNLLEKLESNEDKSELAHRLAVKLNDGKVAKLSRLQREHEAPGTKEEPCEAEITYDGFSVPPYIEDAIKWVLRVSASV